MSISGKTFGSWVVIKDVGNSKWLCRCKCGKYKEVKKYSLIHGKSKSCGCSYKYTINIGDVYNNLLVESSYLDKERQRTVYICKCLLCGNTKQVLGKDLARGKVKSCGCLVRSINGQSKTRLYSIWKAMTNRCQNKMHKAYNRYGGRGIICMWQTFEEFKHDMYDSYLAHVKEFGEKNTTIDRIDPNGNYCKENCRWATYKVQNNHLRPRIDREDILGERFGRLVVQALDTTKTKAYYICKCDCGNEVVVIRNSLLDGMTRSCGCLHRDRCSSDDSWFINKKFNKLTVIDFAYIKNRRKYYRCICDCGNLTVARGSDLKNGHKKTCGKCKKESV